MLTSAKNTYFIIGAILLLAGAIIGAVLLWLNNSDLTSQIVAEEEQLAIIRSETRSRATVLSLASQIKPSAETVGKYFISPDNVASFIEVIEKLGKESGVAIKISQASVKSGVSLNLEITGQFSQVINLVHLLESAPFYIQITKVSVNTVTTSDTQGGSKNTSQWSGSIALTLLSFEQ